MLKFCLLVPLKCNTFCKIKQVDNQYYQPIGEKEILTPFKRLLSNPGQLLWVIDHIRYLSNSME